MSLLRAWGQTPHDDLGPFLERVREVAGDGSAALRLADEAAGLLPRPGEGSTARLWAGLIEIAAVDLTVARALEPHLDALAILAQAQQAGYAVPPVEGTTWGVFAAEGPGTRLEVTPTTPTESAAGTPPTPTESTPGTPPTPTESAPGTPPTPTESTPGTEVLLRGRKPWCSLADRLDRALVTAWVDEKRRALVAVDLLQDGVTAVDEPWAARGLVDVPSIGLDLADARGTVVGPPGWYLTRPGFVWGGLGVAACWLGGAIGLARSLREAAGAREPDQIALLHLGEVDAALTASLATLEDAAAAVDAGLAEGEHAWPRCVRARHVVHEACESVLRAAAHGLGPGPLAGDEAHARRVADLQLYLRQHKAERDAAVVGRAIADGMPVAW